MKLLKDFYQKPALAIAKDFLGKYLVYQSPKGKLSGKIIDVEAYPAFVDNVSHANKKTHRTKVIWQEGGYAYIYLIYGIHYQFAIVVNKLDVPEVVFIRAVIPDEGIEIMKKNFGKPTASNLALTKSPGNLCKSFGIDMSLYGEDLTSSKMWLEDRGIVVPDDEIKTTHRVGINPKLEGKDSKYRFYIKK